VFFRSLTFYWLVPVARAQLRNSEYLEAEGELDLIDEDGRVLFAYPRGALRQHNPWQLSLAQAAGVSTQSSQCEPDGEVIDVCKPWVPALPQLLKGAAVDSSGFSAAAVTVTPVALPLAFSEPELPVLPCAPLPVHVISSHSRIARKTTVQSEAPSRHAFRQALSLVLGASLPPLPPPTVCTSANSVARLQDAASSTSKGPASPNEPTDPLIPILLAADPDLMLNSRRLQQLTSCLDAPHAEDDSSDCTQTTSPARPSALLLALDPPLLAMPVLLPTVPIQELLTRQYATVVGDFASGLHGAVKTTIDTPTSDSHIEPNSTEVAELRILSVARSASVTAAVAAAALRESAACLHSGAVAAARVAAEEDERLLQLLDAQTPSGPRAGAAGGAAGARGGRGRKLLRGGLGRSAAQATGTSRGPAPPPAPGHRDTQAAESAIGLVPSSRAASGTKRPSDYALVPPQRHGQQPPSQEIRTTIVLPSVVPVPASISNRGSSNLSQLQVPAATAPSTASSRGDAATASADVASDPCSVS
jgi:hypothetical protein